LLSRSRRARAKAGSSWSRQYKGRFHKKFVFAVAALLAGTAASAQPGGQPDFIGVAKVIAEQDGISVGEAVRRIKMQERIFRLQERLFDSHQ
jgi:hypothetical protein